MKDFPAITEGVDFSTSVSYSAITIPDGAECGHKGCRSHITHPCEGCGRIAAKGGVVVRIT